MYYWHFSLFRIKYIKQDHVYVLLRRKCIFLNNVDQSFPLNLCLVVNLVWERTKGVWGRDILRSPFSHLPPEAIMYSAL